MPLPHKWARDVLLGAWPLVTSEPPTLSELQLAGSVAMLETQYGTGWKGEGAGSNNWGAVKCSSMPPCPDTCFQNADFGGQFCFRRYPTPEEGAAHTIKLLTVNRPTVWAAMRTGDAMLTAAEMSRTRYFQADPKMYGIGLAKRSTVIAEALGEPLAVFGLEPLPSPVQPTLPAPTSGTSGASIVAGVVGLVFGYGAVRVLWVLT